MLKYKITYIAVFAAAVVLFLCINTLQAFVFLIAAAAIPIIVKLSVVRLSRKIELNCEMSSACVAGSESNPIIFTIKNNSYIPFGSIEAEIEYENHMFGEKSTEHIVFLNSLGKSEFKIPSQSDRCGRCSVSVKNVYCSDALKITRNNIKFRWEKNYTVYPVIPKIYAETNKRLASDFTGSKYDRFKSGQDLSEIFQLREYHEGDDISSVHWKLSGKMNELIIKEGGRPENFRILVFCGVSLYDSENNYIDPKINEAVFGAAQAISLSLSNHGINHHLGTIIDGTPIEREIISSNDSQDMLDDFMSVAIPKKYNNVIKEIIDSGYIDRYSKLIYVTSKFDKKSVSELASYINITVVSVDDGKTDDANTDGYAVYNINSKNMNDAVYITV